MYAAVIEFDALPDAVGPGAEHHHFLFIGADAFVFAVERGVEVIGFGFKLCGAGIHHFIHPADAELFAPAGHFFF
ncbi:MAG: hypothetical protein IPJ82_08125 [Lewinellaceae bacterium]|nr:hypothetical protein [Lewinellaceae bacterium]